MTGRQEAPALPKESGGFRNGRLAQADLAGMTRSRTILLVTIGALVVTAAVIGGWLINRADNHPPAPTAASTNSTTTTVADKPITQAQDAWLTEMEPWLPDLRDDPTRALGRAENTCLDINSGKPEAVIIDNARQRFGRSTPISTGNAIRIVNALKTHDVCASF